MTRVAVNSPPDGRRRWVFENIRTDFARDFYQATGAGAKEVAVTPGADHDFTSISWEREVIARTVNWFERYV